MKYECINCPFFGGYAICDYYDICDSCDKDTITKNITQ